MNEQRETPSWEDVSGLDSGFTSESDDEELSWVAWFCGRKGNEFFCEVDREYIEDNFNLYGLRNLVPHYSHALDMILDLERVDSPLTDEQAKKVEQSADMLYGLIHARYVVTSAGLASVVEKFYNVDYGRCPRFYCDGQSVLPVGLSDVPRASTVMLYCPKCQDVYVPRSHYTQQIDGAYFGTSLPHLLMEQYPQIVPPKPTQSFVPRVFGFKIHGGRLGGTNPPQPPASSISI